MNGRSRKIRKADRRGVAVTEAAIVLPVMVLLVLGMVEFGRLTNFTQVLQNAARHGARTASLTENSNDEVIEAVQQALMTEYPSLEPEMIQVTMECLSHESGEPLYEIQNLNDNEVGQPIRVSVSVGYGDVSQTASVLGMGESGVAAAVTMERN